MQCLVRYLWITGKLPGKDITGWDEYRLLDVQIQIQIHLGMASQDKKHFALLEPEFGVQAALLHPKKSLTVDLHLFFLKT